MTSRREPTSAEMAAVAAQLSALRRTFAVWSDNYHDEFDLLWFVYYEGCDEPVMAAAAPYAVGNSLAKKDGFRWAMVRSSRSWRHAICHAALPEPIALPSLEGGEWYRPEPGDEPPLPGEATLESRDFIRVAVEWKRIAGRDAPLPQGSLSEAEQQVARARVSARPSEERLWRLHDQLAAASPPADGAILSFIESFGRRLQTDCESAAEGLLAAVAPICCHRPRLIEPLMQQALRPLAYLGCERAEQVQEFVRRFLAQPSTYLPLSPVGRAWLADDFPQHLPAVQRLLNAQVREEG